MQSTDNFSSLDSEDDFRTGCRNVSHHQQFFSELLSPGRSHFANYHYSQLSQFPLISPTSLPKQCHIKPLKINFSHTISSCLVIIFAHLATRKLHTYIVNNLAHACPKIITGSQLHDVKYIATFQKEVVAQKTSTLEPW